MGCGCGGRKRSGGAATFQLRPSDVSLTPEGYYATSNSGECSGTYHGSYTTASLWVVGAGTPEEKMFRTGQRGEAIRLANDADLPIDQLPAIKLCHEAVVAVLGS